MDCYELFEENTIGDKYYTLWVVASPSEHSIGPKDIRPINLGGPNTQLYRVALVDWPHMILQHANGVNTFSFKALNDVVIPPNYVMPLQIHIQRTKVRKGRNIAVEGLPMGESDIISVAIVSPKKGYKIRFLGAEDALWTNDGVFCYVMSVKTPRGKHMYLDLKVSQMYPPLDIDQVFREQRLKRRSVESVDKLRAWTSEVSV